MFAKDRSPFAGKSNPSQRYDSLAPSGPNYAFDGGMPPTIHPQMPEATPGPSPAIIGAAYPGAEIAYVGGMPSSGDRPDTVPMPSGTPFDTGESMAMPVVSRDIGTGMMWQQGGGGDENPPAPRLNNSATGSDPMMSDQLTPLTGTGRE